MDDILKTILHSVFSVVLLFILTRLLGKRHLSQLTFFDYVVGISIGSIAAEFAVNESIPYTRGIIGLVVYALFPIALSLISLKSYRGRKLLDGKPTILIQNGVIVERSLKKTRMNTNDLLEECRLKDIFDIAEIEFAVLETNGKLSVLLKSQNKPVIMRDMGLPAAYQGLCTNLVLDGRILQKNLSAIGRDEAWLLGELKNQNAGEPGGILLAYLDTSSQLHVYFRHDDPPLSPMM